MSTYVDEGYILSTCNRVELYGVMCDVPDEQALARFLAEWKEIAPDALLPHVYTLTGDEAVRHVFRLASGLDSMVLGEDQIVSQIKTAMVAAHEAGTLGNGLHRLLQSALATGKLVRTETGIARTPVSVVSVALDLARQMLGSLSGKRVAVIGAGRMAELTLKHLHCDRSTAVCVLSRTYARAVALAERFGTEAASLSHLELALHDSDVVISCTSAPGIVLDIATVRRALAGRASPLLLLDLAVPRDIDQQVAMLPGVQLCDVDDLQTLSLANHAQRAAEVAKAEALVAHEVAALGEWWAAQQVVPTIRALRARAEAIREAELQRTLARLPDLSPREQQAVQALSTAIINKLLHQPITMLKDPHAGGDLAQAVQQLFQLS